MREHRLPWFGTWRKDEENIVMAIQRLRVYGAAGKGRADMIVCVKDQVLA